MNKIKEIERASLLLTWLEKPYYLNRSPLYNTLISFIMGFIVYVFLVVVRPPVFLKITTNFNSFALTTSIIISSVFLIFHFIIKRIFIKYFNSEGWTVIKHLSSFFIVITIASLINWNGNSYIKKFNDIEINNYFQFLAIGIGSAMIPISFYLMIDERYGKYKKNNPLNNKLIETKKTLKENITNNKLITINSYNNKDFVSFYIKQLLYVTAEANYVSFFILENDIIEELVLRNTLKKVENQLSRFDTIIRCHKSYIINKDFVINFEGNAHGYRLNLKHQNKKIPVSRKFKKEELISLVSSND